MFLLRHQPAGQLVGHPANKVSQRAGAAPSQKTKLRPPALFLCDSLDVPHFLLWRVRGRRLALFSLPGKKKKRWQWVACKPLDSSITGEAGGRDRRVECALVCYYDQGVFLSVFFFPSFQLHEFSLSGCFSVWERVCFHNWGMIFCTFDLHSWKTLSHQQRQSLSSHCSHWRRFFLGGLDPIEESPDRARLPCINRSRGSAEWRANQLDPGEEAESSCGLALEHTAAGKGGGGESAGRGRRKREGDGDESEGRRRRARWGSDCKWGGE